jgi:hypothetical protein
MEFVPDAQNILERVKAQRQQHGKDDISKKEYDILRMAIHTLESALIAGCDLTEYIDVGMYTDFTTPMKCRLLKHGYELKRVFTYQRDCMLMRIRVPS